MSEKRKQSKIPRLDLNQFSFSPPGPMGWSFAEYEKMLENLDHVVLNEKSVKDNLEVLEQKELTEYPTVPISMEERDTEIVQTDKEENIVHQDHPLEPTEVKNAAPELVEFEEKVNDKNEFSTSPDLIEAEFIDVTDINFEEEQKEHDDDADEEEKVLEHDEEDKNEVNLPDHGPKITFIIPKSQSIDPWMSSLIKGKKK
jgi:Ran GTPase-activating protein (RanGAP) involved in mRNA processing and transport